MVCEMFEMARDTKRANDTGVPFSALEYTIMSSRSC